MAMMQEKNDEEIQKEFAFLAENSKKAGVVITSTGLQYEIITETDGPKPSISNTILAHYTGKFTDDTIFDSSYSRGVPAEFPVYGVIPGWTEGLQLMSVGSKYKFIIPSELGYGPNGWGNIPPYSTLIFEVELIDILD
jgi:FKBP-type peptidyl-prolyl cis-trans isomerase